MECLKCGSDRILIISAKCNDMCSLNFKGAENNDYVPSDLNIGGGDYIELDICLQCGVAQGLSDEPDPDFYTEHEDELEDSAETGLFTTEDPVPSLLKILDEKGESGDADDSVEDNYYK